MALTVHGLRLIAPHLNGARVLCLGYPDLLVTTEAAASVLRCRPVKASPHGDKHKFPSMIADTADAFEAAGVRQWVAIDCHPWRGMEEFADLNDDICPLLRESFDLVIDAGTIEHCANVGHALRSAAEAVARNGRVFHAPPVSMVNHGFYNINPTLLMDFYELNGWTVEHLSAFVARPPDYPLTAVEPRGRFNAPPNACLQFIARRGDEAADDLQWPVQRKYMPEPTA